MSSQKHRSYQLAKIQGCQHILSKLPSRPLSQLFSDIIISEEQVGRTGVSSKDIGVMTQSNLKHQAVIKDDQTTSHKALLEIFNIT